MNIQKRRKWTLSGSPPVSGNSDDRRDFFLGTCVKQNLTQLELSDCVNDNELASRRAAVTQKCDAIKDDPAASTRLVPFVDTKKIFVLKYRFYSILDLYSSTLNLHS
jgi:hypothetical protein